MSLACNFESLLEDTKYLAFIQQIVDIYNTNAGPIKIAAGYSLVEFFQKPINSSSAVIHLLREVSKMLSLSNLIINCNCFDKDVSQVSNQLLLALCSTQIGIDIIVQHESIENYLCEPGYNPEKRDILLHLTQRAEISALLPPQLFSSLKEALKSKSLISTSEVEMTSK